MKRRACNCEAQPARDRIVGAAFRTFLERGYARASTLDIATRAKVSKRELYSHFENKEALFAAGIAERTAAMRIPLDLPEVTNREELSATFIALGIAVLNGVIGDDVLAVYRLAIAESERSPDIAATLDRAGRGEIRRATTTLIARAQARGLLGRGEPSEIAEHFSALLWSDILVRLLLRVARKPSAKDIARRAQIATELLLRIYPVPAARALAHS